MLPEFTESVKWQTKQNHSWMRWTESRNGHFCKLILLIKNKQLKQGHHHHHCSGCRQCCCPVLFSSSPSCFATTTATGVKLSESSRADTRAGTTSDCSQRSWFHCPEFCNWTPPYAGTADDAVLCVVAAQPWWREHYHCANACAWTRECVPWSA